MMAAMRKAGPVIITSHSVSEKRVGVAVYFEACFRDVPTSNLSQVTIYPD